MSDLRKQLIEQANRLLADSVAADPAELLERARDLESNRALRHARLLLLRAVEITTATHALRPKIEQRLARCTYKDPDLPVHHRLDEAERILARITDLATTTDQETLGLAGAIQKRRWEAYGQKQHLERALAYYKRGFALGPEHDGGYTGINAAFVLDQLASAEEVEAKRAGTTSDSAPGRRAEAGRIRQAIVAAIGARPAEDHDWWSLATVAEAWFGLGDYAQAGEWLRRARAHADSSNVPDWQIESTARQLASLYRLQTEPGESTRDFAESPAARVLHEFLGHGTAAVLRAYRGKVGLALSGGGFRAALFHIGVLARLAELDVLRHVEVLSCVSGGSIIGAHYYLELRTLLETKPDALIDRRDYVDIVRRIEKDFLAGVQANIRTRMASNVIANVRMLLSRSYSRTHRVGELYEEHIYSRVADANGRTPRWLNGLFVRPQGESSQFHPSFDNWRRSAKVPVLVINATSLNTGHAWQFTASWMGEPPTGIDDDIDSNDRYRRMYYGEAPPKYRSFRLGHAVAASSCVPGLFEPLPITGLYPDRVVRLVDGGVHDNQGIASLLEQNCEVLIVSDASGQMSTDPKPGDGLLQVPLRSNNILMSRVREAQFQDLAARRRASLIRGLLFLHLKQDLPSRAISWVGCEEPATTDRTQSDALTDYGIRRDLQARLAALRTDLDSFSDIEACALMASGYRMAKHEFGRRLPEFDAPGSPDIDWRFHAVDDLMTGAVRDARTRRLERILAIAKNRGLKIWSLSPVLKFTGATLLFAVAAGALLFLLQDPDADILRITRRTLLDMSLPIAAGVIFGGAVARVVRYRSAFGQYVFRAVIALVGWLVAGIHLQLFDRLYLRYGRLTASPAPSRTTTAPTAPAMPPEEPVAAEASSHRVP